MPLLMLYSSMMTNCAELLFFWMFTLDVHLPRSVSQTYSETTEAEGHNFVDVITFSPEFISHNTQQYIVLSSDADIPHNSVLKSDFPEITLPCNAINKTVRDCILQRCILKGRAAMKR